MYTSEKIADSRTENSDAEEIDKKQLLFFRKICNPIKILISTLVNVSVHIYAKLTHVDESSVAALQKM